MIHTRNERASVGFSHGHTHVNRRLHLDPFSLSRKYSSLPVRAICSARNPLNAIFFGPPNPPRTPACPRRRRRRENRAIPQLPRIFSSLFERAITAEVAAPRRAYARALLCNAPSERERDTHNVSCSAVIGARWRSLGHRRGENF